MLIDSHDRLSKRELGELLELLGKQLAKESEVEFRDLAEILEKFRLRRGYQRSTSFVHATKDALGEIVSYLENFDTSDDLRDFVEVISRKPVPYKMGKDVLRKLAVGTVLTSGLDFVEVKNRWQERQTKTNSLNIYQMPKEKLKATLLDDELFPSGYSIISFARRFKIRLPVKSDKTVLINILINQLFERPSSSRRIGRWGLKDKPEGSE